MNPTASTIVIAALFIGGLAGYMTAMRQGIMSACKNTFQSQKPFFIVTPRSIQALIYTAVILVLALVIAIIGLVGTLDGHSLYGGLAAILAGIGYAAGTKAAPKQKAYYLALCLSATRRYNQRLTQPRADVQQIIAALEQRAQAAKPPK